ncbi:MAG: hypothetical protein H7329_20500 [Opitutaceae bacterium]|nr:hypothetical protein [Cytophagales bacterium]
MKSVIGIFACMLMMSFVSYAKPHHPRNKNKHVRGTEHIHRHHSPNAMSNWGYSNI